MVMKKVLVLCLWGLVFQAPSFAQAPYAHVIDSPDSFERLNVRDGQYEIPVQSESLKAYNTMEVDFQSAVFYPEQRHIFLEVKIPFLMSGQEDLLKVFSGTTDTEAPFELIELGQGDLESQEDRLICSQAVSQNTITCLAHWPSLKGGITLPVAQERIRAENPLMTDLEVRNRAQVSEIFSSDAIGILRYTIGE